MVVKVSSKGQVVLPASIRRSLDIKAGDELVVVEWGNAIYLVPKPKDPIAEARGILKRLGTTTWTWEDYKAERAEDEARRERHLMGIPDE